MVTKEEFFKAISRGNEEIVKQAIDEGFDLNTVSCGSGGTALNMVVSLGNVALSQILIDNGANLEACTNSGITPLRSAIACLRACEKEKKSDYLAIIEILLVAGAKPTYINKQGEEKFAYLLTDGRARRQIYEIFVKLGIVAKSHEEIEAQKHTQSIQAQAVTEKPVIQETHSFKKPYLPQLSFLETVTSMFFDQPKKESEDRRPLIKSGPKLKQE